MTVTLQQARKARRLSQLELSMRVGVSQRHVSFVESVLARPSRDLLRAWLQELDAPLVARNAAMLQAGYAPAYSAAPLGDPALAQANEALVHLLRAHDPMPALVMDALWNPLHVNHGAQWLVATLMPQLAELPAGTPMNMLDMLAHPEGLTRHMVNLADVGPALLAHLREDAAAHPALTPKVAAFAAMLHSRLAPGTRAWLAARQRTGLDHAVRHPARRAGVLQHVHHVRHAAGHHTGVAAGRTYVRR